MGVSGYGTPCLRGGTKKSGVGGGWDKETKSEIALCEDEEKGKTAGGRMKRMKREEGGG